MECHTYALIHTTRSSRASLTHRSQQYVFTTEANKIWLPGMDCSGWGLHDKDEPYPIVS